MEETLQTINGLATRSVRGKCVCLFLAEKFFQISIKLHVKQVRLVSEHFRSRTGGTQSRLETVGIAIFAPSKNGPTEMGGNAMLAKDNQAQ